MMAVGVAGGVASRACGVGYGPWASPTSGVGSRPDFEPVLDAFAENFDTAGEVGAAVCVYVDGRPVVDLWGGAADATTGRPWASDSVVLVYSSTKGVTSVCANLLIERGRLDPGGDGGAVLARVRGRAARKRSPLRR